MFQNIRNFIICLWDNPKIIYKLILYIDINELKNNIFPLIINNFYENIFSSNDMENQLIYIFILFINEEINKINSLNEKKNFLENEIFNMLINELLKKVEIQNYFVCIIQNVINEINIKTKENFTNDNDYTSDNKINLDILNIEKNINNTINEKEKEKENEGKKGKKGKTKTYTGGDSILDYRKKNLKMKNQTKNSKNFV